MMPFLPARMRVFPHSGFKNMMPFPILLVLYTTTALMPSRRVVTITTTVGITPGISRLIRVTLKCIINQTTIKKVEIKIRKKINIIV